jgi:hypothetical protein
MEMTQPIEVYSCTDLVGFWQFSDSTGQYFGVLEREEDDRSTLAIGSLHGESARVLKRISEQDASIHAIDATPVGAELLFALELNRVTPLQVVRAAVATLIDPDASQVRFADLRDVELSPQQLAIVQLPPAKLWHVADALAPRRWLFSPRLVRGQTREPEIIVNTADGHAVILALNTGGRPEAVEDAAEPQAYVLDGRRFVAFLRYDEPNYPFWLLPRYSGDTRPMSGSLFVATGDTIQNLSSQLDIGPVTAIALTRGPDNMPWLFALRPATGLSEIVALRHDGGWSIAERWNVDAAAERLSVEYAGNSWHVLHAARANGWSLRYQKRPAQ